MPEQGVSLIPHKKILTFEEIVEFTRVAVSMGVDKVRITGGEPLVRKGVVNLVSMLASLQGIKDLSMTTNGVLLDQFAEPLARAGLHRVNISLDTLNPAKFLEITRVGTLEDVLRGIEAAQKAGLSPVKINCVIKKSPLEPDAVEVARYSREHGLKVRYIKEMDLGKGTFSQVIGGEGGKCSSCNRLRLTADGKLKPCLFSDLAFDIRELGFEKAIMIAAGRKPASGERNLSNKFNNIGG